MLINIKTLTGEVIPFELENNCSISEFKEQIQDKHQIPANMQQLIYNHKVLDNPKTLADYDIPDNSTIHLVLNR